MMVLSLGSLDDSLLSNYDLSRLDRSLIIVRMSFSIMEVFFSTDRIESKFVLVITPYPYKSYI